MGLVLRRARGACESTQLQDSVTILPPPHFATVPPDPAFLHSVSLRVFKRPTSRVQYVPITSWRSIQDAPKAPRSPVRSTPCMCSQAASLSLLRPKSLSLSACESVFISQASRGLAALDSARCVSIVYPQ